MKKSIAIFIFLLCILGCSDKRVLFYEKYGEIYSYNFSNSKTSLFMSSEGKGLWNTRFNETGDKMIVVEETFYENEKDRYSQTDIKLFSYPNKKMIDKIGEERFNEYNGQFCGNKIVFVTDEWGENSVEIFDLKNKERFIISEKGKNAIYPIVDNVNKVVYFQEYDIEKSKWSIWRYDIVRKEKVAINDFGREFQYPNLSFDGDAIVVEETEQDKTYIGIYYIKEEKYKRLTNTGIERFPIFTDDEESILFVHDGNLHSINLNTKIDVPLTFYTNDKIVSNIKYAGNDMVVYDLIDGENTYVEIFMIKNNKQIMVDIGKASVIRR